MNQRISPDRRVLILSALAEGTPINACCRMFAVGKHAVLRVIRETGEALGDYMHRSFRNLRCDRLAMDECWTYCGKHGARMQKREETRGDFYLWACIDSDTKLLLSHMLGRRAINDCMTFVKDVSKRVVTRGVQITTDAFATYGHAVSYYFEGGWNSHVTETKHFTKDFDPADYPESRKRGVDRIVKADREVVFGHPDLSTATTSAAERVFLTLRQELTRLTRCSLAYSKDLDMHRAAITMQIGIYNLCRRHTSLDGATPAMAAGVEDRRWSMRDVVELTENYWQPIYAAQQAKKAAERRAAEDALFISALSEAHNN